MSKIDYRRLRPLREIIEDYGEEKVKDEYGGGFINNSMRKYFGDGKHRSFKKLEGQLNDTYTHTYGSFYYHESWFEPEHHLPEELFTI